MGEEINVGFHLFAWWIVSSTLLLDLLDMHFTNDLEAWSWLESLASNWVLWLESKLVSYFHFSFRLHKGVVIGTSLYILSTDYPLVDFIRDIIWLNVHLGCAIICACLPTYRPIFVMSSKAFSNSFQKYYSSGSGKDSGSGSGRTTSNSRTGKLDKEQSSLFSPRLRNDENYTQSGGEHMNLVEINAGPTRGMDSSGDPILFWNPSKKYSTYG